MFKIYSYYSWGIPLAIVLIANIIDRFPVPEIIKNYKPDYATQICWMNNKNATALFFLLPVGALILENFFFFVMTVHGIRTNQLDQQTSKQNCSGTSVKFAESQEDKKWTRHKNKVYFIIYLKLSVLMGLTWLFGFLAAFLKLNFLWYPFIILNSLQAEMKKGFSEI